ncbi:MAG: hypothetical protein GX369_05395 [Euryarchaeota archaeon]|nr:hypothetical protein [Euryarchaeota archaeon]
MGTLVDEIIGPMTMDYGNLKAGRLEATHAIKILIILYFEGKMIKGVLASYVAKGTVSVQSRVDELLQLDLVTEEQEQQRPFRKFIELTPKGRAVAEHLAAIEELLQGEGR